MRIYTYNLYFSTPETNTLRGSLDQPEPPSSVDIRVVNAVTAESLQNFAEMLH
jgi:hypothetical protein